MKFTYNIEEEGKIVFLDMLVKRKRGLITYELFQKATHSGTYLDYTSHCPIVTKINIIRNETRRIVQNCMEREEAYPHLEKLRENLLNSNYPLHIIEKYISKSIYEIDHNVKPTPKVPHDFMYKIPYVSETFTKKIKRVTNNSGFNISVVVQSGMPLQSLLRSGQINKCECISCLAGIPCNI